jgi:hypothetical protein
VRTPKASERDTHCLSNAERGTSEDTEKGQRARGTHSLSNAEGGSSEHGERKPANEYHSRTVERRGRDNEDRKKVYERMRLTLY